jgi:hypothetical protein
MPCPGHIDFVKISNAEQGSRWRRTKAADRDLIRRIIRRRPGKHILQLPYHPTKWGAMALIDDEYGRARRGSLQDHREGHGSPDGSAGWPGKRAATSQLIGAAARMASDGTAPPPGAHEAMTVAASSPGMGLPGELRGRLETSLGTDLGRVQVHIGPESAAAAASVGAVAYATGQDIHFGAGRYDPGSPGGEALIAHEVAHTVQQRGASIDVRQDRLAVSSPGDAHEVEAEAFAQSFIAGHPAAVTPVSAGSVSRMVISRQLPNAPQPGGAAAQPASRTFTFNPAFAITPGGLAPGGTRNQTQVFRGDTLKFRAECENFTSQTPSQVQPTFDGRVVGIAGAPQVAWNGNAIEWTVVVGNMGTPARPGDPPQPVDAHAKVHIAAPAPDTGDFEHTWSFKVVADLQWLSDRCDIAAQRGSAAYHQFEQSLHAAYGPYKAAYLAHKQALQNHERREQMIADIILNVFLAGVAGAAGGAVSQWLKGTSRELSVAAGSTAVGDITKYVVRLGISTAAAGSGPAHGAGSPSPADDPTSGGGSASGGVGFDPDLWLASRDAAINGEAASLATATANLKTALSEAWAAGRTERMDQDPLDILQPYVDAMSAPLPVRAQQQYAHDLWQHWLVQFAYRVNHISRAGDANVDRRGGGAGDGKLIEEIKHQTGDPAMVDAAIGTSRQNAIDEARRQNIARHRPNPEPNVDDG